MRVLFAAAAAFFAAMASPLADDGGALQERLVLEALRAADNGDMRFSFAVDFDQTQNDQQAAFKARYDPRLEEGAQWTLEGASLDDLDEHARKTFESLQASGRGDDGIIYDKLGESLTQDDIDKLVLDSETETAAIFTTPLAGDDVPAGKLELVIHFDKQGDYVSRIDLRTIDDFKPNPAVKIKSMRQSQYFSPPAEKGGPAFLWKSENVTEGSAFFKKFKSDTRMVFSNVEEVDVPVIGGSEDALQ